MIQRKFKRIVDLVGLKHFSLVDVGISGGIDPKWKVLGDRLFIVGFEPNEEEYKKLCNVKNARYFNIALADKRCHLEFFIHKKQATSSCYKANFNFLKRFPMVERFNLKKIVSIEADSLDNVLSAGSFKQIDFMKIDAQGYELNILRGGQETLHNVCGLEVEVEFSMLYQKQTLFADIDDYLRNVGFTLFDLRPAYWKRIQTPSIKGVGQIVVADALYFKDYIATSSIPKEIGPPIIMAIVYNKHDYAIELVEYLYNIKRINFDKKKEIISILYKLAKPICKIPDFRGKARLASYLEKITDLLKCTYWARWDSWR